MKINTIVTAEWLNENLNNPNVIILDASAKSSHNGTLKADATPTIPHSRFFDLEVFKDASSSLPNTAPSAEHFENECRKLGINNSSEIVVFDNVGIFTSPRVWWLFKLMGHNNISVLNGGLPLWIQQGFTVTEKAVVNYKTGDFKAKKQDNLLITFDDIKNNAEQKDFTIVDARSSGRFKGIDEEPRKYLKSGNIPHSVNIPYKAVLDNGMFKSEEELKAIFESQCNNIDSTDNIVFSCGSGITSCIIMLASEIGFKKSKKVYDGSWTEWAELNNLTTHDR